MTQRRPIKFNLLALLICLIGFPDILYSQSDNSTQEFSKRNNLTGSWNGIHPWLNERGFSLDINIVGDLMWNVAGGIDKQAVFMENIDLKLLIEGDKVIGWRGLTFFVSGIQNNGGSISKFVGDVQSVSNIEAEKTVRLYEAWIQKNFLDNRLSLLSGFYDINSEFDFMESASLFIQSSQGIGGEFAASGLVGAPTFPAPGLGARLKFVPVKSVYLQTGIFDGVPGKLNSLKKADFSLNSSDGYLLSGEIGLLTFSKKNNAADTGQGVIQTRQLRSHIGREVTTDYRTKIAVGFWSYTRNYVFERYGEALPRLTDGQNDKGIYMLVDLKWNPESWKSYQEFSIYGRAGFTETDVSRFKSYFGFGFTFKGILPIDQDGLLGFSLASVRNSKVFNQINQDTDDFETALELTYLTKVIPWLNIQPDIQYILNPGTDPELNHSWILGLRTDITL